MSHSRENRDFRATHHFTFGVAMFPPHPDPPPEGEGNRYVPSPSRGRSGGGWGICRSAPCVQRPNLWVKISLLKGGNGGIMNSWKRKKGTVPFKDCPLFRGYGEGGEGAFYFFGRRESFLISKGFFFIHVASIETLVPLANRSAVMTTGKPFSS